MVKLSLSIILKKRPEHSRGVVELTSRDPVVGSESQLSKNQPRERRSSKKRLLTVLSVILLVGVAGFFVWVLKKPNTQAVVNPFTSKITVSMQFPLYYPTSLPTGYKIDPNSVTIAKQGVVVFDLVGPKKSKIYISEEARPNSFNLGGFYNKFNDMKEIPVAGGAIATGTLNNGATEISSRANNKTWILSNTTSKVPLDQLTNMLRSLTLSY